MTVIRIQEFSEHGGVFQAKVCCNEGPEYDITIRDPFSKEEEERLEWYFERHLEIPFINQVKAQEVATSIISYGESLFAQMFANEPDILAAYETVAKVGLTTLQIEIVGSPSFHALHWEALKDPALPHPLALQVMIVRKNVGSQIFSVTGRPSPTINLLIVIARPRGSRDMGYRTISRPLVEALRQNRLPVKIDILRPGTYKAFENHLRTMTEQYGVGYYHVVHFDLHGSLETYDFIPRWQRKRPGRQDIQPYEGLKAFLALESEQEGNKDLVAAEELATLLMQHQIPIAILNACQSGKQIGVSETSLGSHLVKAGVQFVLAMGYSVTASAAQLFMKTLYERLFANVDLPFAVRDGRMELFKRKDRRAYFDQKINLEDWLLPVVYQNHVPQLRAYAFTSEEGASWPEQKDEGRSSRPPEPLYGFVGRDVDILQIERYLLLKSNILLIRGMGGAGKTTLLRHLGTWWHTTGFVDKIFYFGYDERAWTCQQIMTTLAQEMYGPKYFSEFQPLKPEKQQAILTQDLRSTNHLLILDNLESITGAQLAIQHTLPQDEQVALHSFLADCAKGRTFVLLGSRSGEDWLAKGTFDDNEYDLPGLDREAASILTDRILEKCNATNYRTDENLQQLLKLLDGFPLALEVVLANLARQSPQDVLAALQSGDMSIDPESDSQQKTESILRCIDYSHSNLSPESQQLLLCLAPFTGVLGTALLNSYTEYLKQQPTLSTLSYERWQAVLQEAENWGLLSPDPTLPRFLRLQPTLPYFLRTRLHRPEQSSMRIAIETAFRDHYREVGKVLFQLLNSQDQKKRQLGQAITHLEYENLVMAVKLAQTAQESITHLLDVLQEYLDQAKKPYEGLTLFQTIEQGFAAYIPEKLASSLGMERVKVIGIVANQYSELNQFAEAKRSYQRVLEEVERATEAETTAKDTMRAFAYQRLGIVAQHQHQFRQAEEYLQQALQFFTQAGNRHGLAYTYHQLGVGAEGQWLLEQAEQYYQQALQLKIEDGDHYSQAATYHGLGNIALEQRQFEQAEYYHQQALQINIAFQDHSGQALSYHCLGRVAEEQEHYKQAEQYYQQALKIRIEFPDRHGQAMMYHHLGIVAWHQQQFEQAEQYNQQALQLFIQLDDRYEQATVYHDLGMVAYARRQFEQAEQYYQQALQLSILLEARPDQAKTYNALGLLACDQQQWSQARHYLMRALEISESLGNNHLSASFLHNLAYLGRVSGDTSLLDLVAVKLGLSGKESKMGLQDHLFGRKQQTEVRPESTDQIASPEEQLRKEFGLQVGDTGFVFEGTFIADQVAILSRADLCVAFLQGLREKVPFTKLCIVFKNQIAFICNTQPQPIYIVSGLASEEQVRELTVLMAESMMEKSKPVIWYEGQNDVMIVTLL